MYHLIQGYRSLIHQSYIISSPHYSTYPPQRPSASYPIPFLLPLFLLLSPSLLHCHRTMTSETREKNKVSPKIVSFCYWGKIPDYCTGKGDSYTTEDTRGLQRAPFEPSSWAWAYRVESFLKYGALSRVLRRIFLEATLRKDQLVLKQLNASRIKSKNIKRNAKTVAHHI